MTIQQRNLMIRYYLKITIRDLILKKGYFIINLLGLVIGITAFTLIVLWIKTETSYDEFHKHANDIYRVDYLLYEEGVLEQHSASGSHPIGREIKNAFPEVLDYTRFYHTECLVKYGDETFKERNILYAQSSFFNLFSFPLLHGKADTSLLALNHAVITEETARKYFGDENPMGKLITIDGANDYQITGIVKSIPQNSHFEFDILLSYDNLIQTSRRWDNSWVSERVYSYILLGPNADVEALQAKLPQIPETFIGESMKKAFYLLEYKLVKLTDIHLHSSVSNELEVNGSYRNVYSLGIIAFLVLLIAFINYLNLSTSRSVERAFEVGIRKVSGALKKDLILQFLTESVLLNLIALIVSFALVFLLLPFFKQLMQSPLQIDYLTIVLLFFMLLSFTGHQGGNITHGEDYLLEPLPNSIKAALGYETFEEKEIALNEENWEETQLYEEVVKPILNNKCVSCHNPKKTKGELLLHSKEGVLKGGENGEVLLFKNSHDSELFRRMILPKEDDEHMPPEGKNQPTNEEIQVLGAWIDAGHPFVGSIKQVGIEKELFRSFFPKKHDYDYPNIEIAIVSKDSISFVEKTGVHVDLISNSTNFLSVSCINKPSFIDNDFEKLLSLKRNIARLDLGGTKVTDALFEKLAQLPNLTVLKLDNTSVTGKNIKILSALEHLKSINLIGSKFEKVHLEKLSSFPKLARVYLYKTKVDSTGVSSLKNGQIKIDFGNYELPPIPSDSIVY